MFFIQFFNNFSEIEEKLYLIGFYIKEDIQRRKSLYKVIFYTFF